MRQNCVRRVYPRYKSRYVIHLILRRIVKDEEDLGLHAHCCERWRKVGSVISTCTTHRDQIVED